MTGCRALYGLLLRYTRQYIPPETLQRITAAGLAITPETLRRMQQPDRGRVLSLFPAPDYLETKTRVLRRFKGFL